MACLRPGYPLQVLASFISLAGLPYGILGCATLRVAAGFSLLSLTQGQSYCSVTVLIVFDEYKKSKMNEQGTSNKKYRSSLCFANLRNKLNYFMNSLRICLCQLLKLLNGHRPCLCEIIFHLLIRIHFNIQCCNTVIFSKRIIFM